MLKSNRLLKLYGIILDGNLIKRS